MQKALISIDYTNDFVATDGLLTCGLPAQNIHNNIKNITNQFLSENELVVFAIDYHKENNIYHPETTLFPAHNIENTVGRELYGEIQSLYDTNKERDNVFWIDKTRYSAFCGTNLNLILRERKINQLYIIGVCTDICVLHTLVDGYNLGYELIVPKDCVASFNNEGHAWALNHFENCMGVKLI